MKPLWYRIGLVAAAIVALAPALLLGSPREVSAHPLGNFTVNRYARIEVDEGGVALRYAVDYAEIPAFQEIRAFDRDGDGAFSEAETSAYLAARVSELASRLELTLNGERVPLDAASSSTALVDGQGGLQTLRLVVDFLASLPPGWQEGVSASFRDRNYDGTPGWRELVIRAGAGVDVTDSSAPTQDISAELTAYPETQLQSPPNQAAATFSFRPGAGTVSTNSAPSREEAVSAPKYLDGFAKLIERQQLTLPFVALSLLAAMAWGAAHALGPGHGKTVVAAYLVGSRGTARHALLLGMVVTFAHVSSVVTLGLVTLYASSFLSTADLYLWLSVASGLLVLVMGCILLFSRFRRFRAGGIHVRLSHHHHHDAHGGEAHPHDHGPSGHAHDHDHGHDHAHGHDGHRHEVTAPGVKGLVLLGVSGGILPCPTALVVMLGAIALDRVEYGLVLITAFSLGLAAVLTGIGIALVYAGRLLEGSGRLAHLASAPFSSRWIQALPMGSAAVITLVGAYLTSDALSAVL
jgi:ABC-type nickel/cobalt efflux system permease component RcnA